MGGPGVTFPPVPDNPDDKEFQAYVIHWLKSFNDWHHTVDVRLAELQGRTRDIRWILIGTILTAAAALADVLLRLAQR